MNPQNNPWANLNPENVIGTSEHKAKWIHRLTQIFEPRIAKIIYAEAMDSYKHFGSFREAVKTISSNEPGIANIISSK